MECEDCANNTIKNTTIPYHVCYPWVAEELSGNASLDEVNAVVMKRNYAGIIFLGISIVLGTIGNAHVIYVFSKRKYKSTVNVVQRSIHVNYRIFILWLAILSLLQCLVNAPLLIVYLVYAVTYPSAVLCKLFRFVLYFVPVTMNLTFIAIAVDRYLVICRTFQNKLTEKHSLFMCLATVLLGCFMTWPAGVLFGRGKTETGIEGLTGYRCYLDDDHNVTILKIQQYFQSFLVLFFFIVLIVLLVLYTKVRNSYKGLLRFRRTSRRYSASTTESFKQQQASQEKQRLWIYGSVTIGYIVSALPYHFLAILWFTQVIVDCDMSLPEAQAFYMFIWSYFFSPVINPIIYGFQDDGFRYSVRAIYRRVSFQTYLFERKNSNDVSLDSHSENQNTADRMRQKEFTDISGIPNTDVKPGQELNGILSSMACSTVGVGELVIKTGDSDVSRA